MTSDTGLPWWERMLLVVGDLVALLIFARIGRVSHNLEVSVIQETLNTGLLFIVSWLAVGVVGDLFTVQALYPLSRTLKRTITVGIIAGVLGVLLRAALQARWPGWTFYLVGPLSSTLILIIWRAGWARLRQMWFNQG